MFLQITAVIGPTFSEHQSDDQSTTEAKPERK
jgi:hypothetical protein